MALMRYAVEESTTLIVNDPSVPLFVPMCIPSVEFVISTHASAIGFVPSVTVPVTVRRVGIVTVTASSLSTVSAPVVAL